MTVYDLLSVIILEVGDIVCVWRPAFDASLSTWRTLFTN